jgi:HSP20 family protein
MEETTMGALTTKRWGADVTPWQELEAFGNRIGRWMENPSLFGPSAFTTPVFRTPLFADATGWMPAVELVESDGEFVLTAEIPGMTKEDVSISVEDNVLTLKGEKKYEHEEERDRMYIREREYGTFERSFALPRNTMTEKIKAEYRDGVVKVHIPKGPEATARRIEIK